MQFRLFDTILWPGIRRILAAQLLLNVVIGLTLPAQVSAQGKGKGKKNEFPPPPPMATDLPSVGYLLTRLEGVGGRDINNHGDVVGFAGFSGYAFDGTTSAVTNLNDLASTWYDLNAATPFTVTTGWTASTAHGINDAGDIVGTASKLATGKGKNKVVYNNRVYVLENAFNRDARPRRFLLLPTRSDVDYWAWRINNWGVVVAGEDDADRGVMRYTPQAEWPYYTVEAIPGTNGLGFVDINDYGVIIDRYSDASGSSRIIPGAGPNDPDQIEYFSGVEFLSISNNYISGYSFITGAAGPMRLPELGVSTDLEVIWPNEDQSYGWSRGVNDRGDTIFVARDGNGIQRSYLYTDEINPATGTRYGFDGNGILPLDQLIVNPDTNWWDSSVLARGINNFNVNGFGEICGMGGGGGFVLTPILLPSP